MNIANLLARKGVRVVTLGPEASIRQALALLAEHNIGAVVIVDTAGRPVGILSERDIVRAAARDEAVFAVSVASIMTRQVILGSPSDDLTSVGHTMTERRVRHLPIVDAGKLVGIVSIRDIVKAQRDQYQGAVDTLEQQILEPDTIRIDPPNP